ncbi:glycine oxidase [Microbulbifer yueqingensis]|uniref:Glycine oxidase n=2 Tax=Microbulbifer yueqingensis TaxID=658219 RepID=A0A1G8UPI9_9GAMM|nr:glycine oxidase [Microbulbifer yueqingensis]
MRIAIAGGGLLGRLSAWRLVLAGAEVTLFEAGSLARPAGACWTAAGMISPLTELIHSPYEVYRMGLESLQLWPRWIDVLERASGQPLHFRRNGSMVVAHQCDAAQLDQFQRDLQRTLGSAATKEMTPLDAAGVSALEPDLQHFSRGVYLRNEADLDNRRLLGVLLDELRRLGVGLVDETAVDCEPHAVVLHKGGERRTFDLVIDCRGMGAKAQARNLRGVRGEVMVVETSEVSFQRPVRLMHPRYKLYAVPKPDGTTVIGATEIESEDLSPISLRSTMELSSALYALHPAFAESRIVETSVNLRPATPDNLPFVRIVEGLVQANGLYRHGYLCGPALVRRVAEAAGLVTEVTTE